MSKIFVESAKRSFVKAVSYRFLIMCTDAVVIAIITKSYAAVFGIVVLSNISSTVLYLLHERLWNKIRWGKNIEVIAPRP